MIIIATFTSCKNNSNEKLDETNDQSIPTEAVSNDKDLHEAQDILDEKLGELQVHIENLEKEIEELKDGNNENKMTFGAIIDALSDGQNDYLFLKMDLDGEFVDSIYIKVPKKDYISYDYLLLTGSEYDGVPCFNQLMEPHNMGRTTQNDLGIQGLNVDEEKYSIVELKPANFKYDDTSIFLIVVVDNNNMQYSQFIHSPRLSGDI